MYSYWIVVNYREAYNIYACNGILFNHESPRRGETFVTRKITRAVSRIVLGLQDCLHLGNLDALRDWGHARDYVEVQWLMMQQDKPEDFVIASGEQRSVRDFVDQAVSELGITLSWHGVGVEETGVVGKIDSDIENIKIKTGQTVVRVDPRYFRPTEVETLLGDPTKAKQELNWTPTTSFAQWVSEMVSNDVDEAKKDTLCLNEGFHTYNYHE